jgi:hypothetical protein
MPGGLREPPNGDPLRLIGHTPTLEAVEYQREAWQLYSRITIRAGKKIHAHARSVSFSVDRELIAMLRENDSFHITRTPRGGLGLSVIRDGELIAAAGAVPWVPLGPDVTVRYPGDLARDAEKIFQTRDPEYVFAPWPVELTVEGTIRLINSGRLRMGSYEITVRHGFFQGLPGVDSSVSIERYGVCPELAAFVTAELLEQTGAVKVVAW